MKILLIHQYFLEEDDPGGSRFNEMGRAWQNLGHDITIIAGMVHYNGTKKPSEYKGKFVKDKVQNGTRVIRTHVSESYNSGFVGRLWGYFSFMFSSLYAGLFVAKDKYDLVLVTSPPLFIGFSGYIISRFKKIPFVFEVRDLWPESAIDTGILTNKLMIKFAYAFEKFIYKKSKLINVLTPAFRKNLMDSKGVSADKVIMIPNAADLVLSEFLLNNFDAEAFRDCLGWQDKFVILYVGAHGVANHLDQLLDAAEKFRETNVMFVLIGMGMKKPYLLEQKESRKLSNVQFIDPVPKSEVFKYILAADMGASVLKKADAFKTVYSNKTFDYMSCKKPVLMAIDGVSRELILESEAGSYVEPENAEEYFQVISGYLHDENRAITEGENGYNFVKKNFERDALAKKYLDLIQEKVLNVT